MPPFFARDNRGITATAQHPTFPKAIARSCGPGSGDKPSGRASLQIRACLPDQTSSNRRLPARSSSVELRVPPNRDSSNRRLPARSSFVNPQPPDQALSSCELLPTRPCRTAGFPPNQASSNRKPTDQALPNRKPAIKPCRAAAALRRSRFRRPPPCC